ncbi:MAG: hypothetical protein ACREP0_10775, partial [Rhodanobacteraceae bacterium]
MMIWDSGLGTRDSGLGTRDSGLGTRDSGLRNQDSGIEDGVGARRALQRCFAGGARAMRGRR